MKIEFVKEEKSNGDVFYFTKVNGTFVNGSLSYDQDKARQRYNFIITKQSIEPIETVLESVEVK